MKASEVEIRVKAEHNIRVAKYDFKDRFAIKEDFRKAHNLVQLRHNTPGLFYLSYGMDDGGKQRWFVDSGCAWEVSFSIRNEVDKCRILGTTVPASMVRDQALIALFLLCRFGGIGAKARKGFGSLSWKEAFSLDECKDKAKDFCKALGLPTATRKADYSLQTALMEELNVPLEDPWTVLDRLGAAVQEHAQKYKHQDKKSVLGLPRKIHGPRFRPNRLQRSETHRAPENLSPKLPEARNGNKTRFAAPVFYHIEKNGKGGSVIRMTAFPSDMIRDRPTSERLLQELFQTIRRELKETAAIVQASPPQRNNHSSYAPRQTPAPRIRNEMTGGLKAGDLVKGVLLEEKTKRGGWKIEVDGNKGPIVNTGEVPGDKHPGDAVEVVIQSANPTNPMFRWPQ